MDQKPLPQNTLEAPKKISFKKEFTILSLAFFLIALFFIFDLFIGSHRHFAKPITIEVKEGETLKQIAHSLKEQGLVSFESILSSLIVMLDGDSHIFSGTYSFDKKEGSYFVAKRIISGDTLARWGGEEFLIFLPETRLTDAINIAERMRRKVAQIQAITEQDIKLSFTASFGVAHTHDSNMSLDELISQADHQLYCAKKLGRNCVSAELSL